MRASATSWPGPTGLAQRAAGPADQDPARGRRAAAVAVRRAEPRRDQLPGLSRGAAGVLPQPGIGRRPRPHPPRAARGHRKRTGQDRRGHPPRETAVARAGQDRPAGGQGDQPLQHGQALHHRDHRRRVHVHPQPARPSPPRPPSTASTCCAPACPPTPCTDDDVVLRYKGLEDVERFFRTLNSELDVRPIRHRLADRVRAHMFLRMLSYYLSWHMKQALAPILFHDNDKPGAAAKRANPVAAAQRSEPRSPKPPANTPKTATRCTASPACSPTWPPSAPTRSNPPTTRQHSPSSPAPPRCSAKPSNSSASHTATATRSQ